MAEQKTNVMRLLMQKKIKYVAHEYQHGSVSVDGITAAALIGVPAEKVFKTLVTRGASKGIYIFVVPVAAELDLKKAAKSVGEKSVAMIHVNELLGLTGYVRGGCSPVGMKKQYPTIFHSGAEQLDTIVVSAGKIGYQVELAPEDLLTLTRGKYADVITED